MASWIEFLEQYGDGKNYALLYVERIDDGRVHFAIEDSTMRGPASVIVLRPEQVAQLKGFLNYED